MVLSTIKMSIPVEKQNDALRAIKSITEQTQDDPDCLSYCIYRDIGDEKILMLQSNWKDDETLDRHIRSKEYRNLLLILEMSLKQPEIRFDTISGSTGIETIEKIRNAI